MGDAPGGCLSSGESPMGPCTQFLHLCRGLWLWKNHCPLNGLGPQDVGVEPFHSLCPDGEFRVV